jgi:hypothetical protein
MTLVELFDRAEAARAEYQQALDAAIAGDATAIVALPEKSRAMIDAAAAYSRASSRTRTEQEAV